MTGTRYVAGQVRTQTDIRPDGEWPDIPRDGRHPALRPNRMTITQRNDNPGYAVVCIEGVNIRVGGTPGARGGRGWGIRAGRSTWPHEDVPDWVMSIVEQVAPDTAEVTK